ncbi:MAG: O-antigen ligase family protein [Candidatus Gracilibacteria bacterium]
MPLEIKLLGLIVIAELFAFIFSVDKATSLVGASYRFQGLIIQLVAIIYFLNAVYIFQKLENSDRTDFFKWLISISVIASCLALIPYFIDIRIFSLSNFGSRVYGTLGNPNYLALLLIAIIPFFGLFSEFKSKISRILIAIGLLITLITLFLTGSRSAWVALIFGLLIASILVVIKKKKYKMLVIVFAIIFIVVGIFTFQKYQNTQIFHRFSMTEDSTGSVTTRLYLQKAGLELFIKHPIFGIGQETIAGQIEPYLPEYLKSNHIFYIDRTHNEFLDILVTQGLAGFIAYMVFWIVLLWNAIKNYLNIRDSNVIHEKILLFAITAIIAIHANYAMNFATISGNILLYLFAGYIVANKMYNKNNNLNKSKGKKSSF